MTYQDTLNYLYHRLPMFQRVGKQAFKKDLTNIIKLMDGLKNVHHTFRSIHIAGTNGKGSTAHILAALLMGNGLKVGLYTSPHYRDFRERIKINGQLMPKRRVSSFVKKNQDLIEQNDASFFEVTVAMAFDYFAQEKVDIAIIETGLGGRLDSTNIITPLLSIITNISLDHQSMLGETLSEIAFEKAGIIKYDIPILIGENQKSILPVFRRKAKEVKAPLFLSDNIVKLSVTDNNYDGLQAVLSINNTKVTIETDLSGAFQEKNIQTAIAAYGLLQTSPVIDLKPLDPIWLKNIREETHFIGRWTILGKSPIVIADSAHNQAGLHLLVKAIAQIPHQNLYIVLGTVNDKDPSYIFDILPKTAFYHFAKAKIPRGLEAKRLSQIATKMGVHGKEYASIRYALAAAKRKAKSGDLVIVTGSIFVVAEVV